MCGFGIICTNRCILNSSAQEQFDFSKHATTLQATSIRQYYNNVSSSESEPTSSIHQSLTSSSSNPRFSSSSLTSSSFSPNAITSFHSSTLHTLEQWLCRRGPDCTNSIHYDMLTNASITPFLSVTASVLQLRGEIEYPTTQPYYEPCTCSHILPPSASLSSSSSSAAAAVATTSQTTPTSIASSIIPSPPNSPSLEPLSEEQLLLSEPFSIANDTTWQQRFFPHKESSKHFEINKCSANSAYSSTLSSPPELSICWNGEAFAGPLFNTSPNYQFQKHSDGEQKEEHIWEEIEGCSDTVQISQYVQNSIQITIDNFDNKTIPKTIVSAHDLCLQNSITKPKSVLSVENSQFFSLCIASSIHDILGQIQGPFATSITHISDPVYIKNLTANNTTNSTNQFRIITTVFCRDKLGRRSLLFRQLSHADINPTPDSINSNSNINNIDQDIPDTHAGFILASQPILLPSDIAKHHLQENKDIDFIIHPDLWHEVPCNGIFFTSTIIPCTSSQFSQTALLSSYDTSIHYIPWNYQTLIQHNLFQLSPIFLSSPPSPLLQTPKTKIPSSLVFPAYSPAFLSWPSPRSILPSSLFPAFYKLGQTSIFSSPSLLPPPSNPPTGGFSSQLFLLLLAQAVARHVHAMPHTKNGDLIESPVSKLSSPNPILKDTAPIAVLFSGGIDCTMIAALLHCYLPPKHPIDLITTAYIGDYDDPYQHYPIERQIPDRVAAIAAFEELSKVFPSRLWRLVKVNITTKLILEHAKVISSLIAPQCTTMDFNIGSILYFSSRGKGLLHPKGYTLPALSKTTEKSTGKLPGSGGTTVRYAGELSHHKSSVSIAESDFITTIVTPTTTTTTKSKLTQQERQIKAQEEALKFDGMILNEEILQFVEFSFPSKYFPRILEIIDTLKQSTNNCDDNTTTTNNNNNNNGIQDTISNDDQIMFQSIKIKTKPNRTLPKLIWQRLNKISGFRSAKDKTQKQAFDQLYNELLSILPNNDSIDTVLSYGKPLTLCSSLLDLKQNPQLESFINVYNNAQHDYSTFCSENVTSLHLVDILCDNKQLSNRDLLYLKLPILMTSQSSDTVSNSDNQQTISIYTSLSRVLLLGSGADEQLAGYGRHRTAYNNAIRHCLPLSLSSDDNEQHRCKIEQRLQHVKSNHDVAVKVQHDNEQNEEDNPQDEWLSHIYLEDASIEQLLHNYQQKDQINVAGESQYYRISELTDQQCHTLQELALYKAIRHDTLRLWLRNLGRDDRILSFWGREARLPFLDEDLTAFISLFRVSTIEAEVNYMNTFDSIVRQISNINSLDNANDYDQYLAQWTEIVNPFVSSNLSSTPLENILHFPLHTLCDLRYQFGIGEKMILRQCAHALGINQAATLHKRAMQFGTKIANRRITGVTKLNEITSLKDILNPFI